ncbi:MAG: Phospholipase D/Transphosphatidylase [Candidatus Magasanikbacteria bacterium GW2011_GWC2_37_14]|uniref:Phospholipase D/Transphosphatidylase n=1 Tax=Candidatus Magasanikbacteria bacterium GW2011_GWC2_37_14 TaxID=1619046 RepID=A0A0G0GE40_9BACT|nr:MAG: Phospholipase D/Transphosphatidylase [Candidatus Magasanikbacteria bacterium GW2011_GWC2_37_14]
MKTTSFKIYSSSKEAWEAMYQAISVAKKSIYWELYIFLDDEIGKPFFDLLEKKAKEGVVVRLVIDNWGNFWFSKTRAESLLKAGGELIFFNERKKRYRGWWKRFWARTHRKILIIDEEIGFLGGVNVGEEMQDWLDIQVAFQGKVVHSLLRAFAKNYIIAGGNKKNVHHLLKYDFRVLHDEAELVLDEPNSRKSFARSKYTEALMRARERVILFSPYYFPDKRFLHALWLAKKRGIRIDLLIPFRSDLRIMTLASYAWFSIMRKLGVNIHLSSKMMHGKGVIVDDDWAMIGSTNLEYTGFYDLYEANIKINEKKIVRKLKDTLEKWIEESKNITDEEWKKRGTMQKLKEWIALKLYRIWHGNK